MKKILLIILVLLPFLLKAQTPGYQGKRFIASYNLDVAPNLTYIYIHLGTPIPFQVYLNHHLNVEYVLWRRFSIAADFSYSQNKPAIFDSSKGQVTTSTMGVNFIFYPNNENTLAPVGNYFKIRVFEGNANSSGYLYNYNTNSIENIKSHNQDIYGFGIGFGNNLIVHDKVVLTASIDMDLNMPFTSNVPIEADVQSHLLTSYLFYLKLGIGGLLF